VRPAMTVESRSNVSGPQESVRERLGDCVQRWKYPTQAKTGLEWGSGRPRLWRVRSFSAIGLDKSSCVNRSHKLLDHGRYGQVGACGTAQGLLLHFPSGPVPVS
jgi:hypothetical protein